MPNYTYRIVEIFESLQGEGFNTGMPSIFIRFGKCNLACYWCDTNYQQFNLMSLDDILLQLQRFKAQNIILTGGEPTIQPNLELLINQLKQQNYFIAIETNGLKPVSSQIDYIAVSPKRIYQQAYQQKCINQANEIRIVVDDTIIPFCEFIEDKIQAQHYFLSPCERNGEMNLLETITQLGKLNQRAQQIKWQLSIQTHKIAQIQ